MVVYTLKDMARYLVVYEKAGNSFGAFSPDLPGCIANGGTLDETRKMMREAMASHIEVLKAEGLEVPPGRPDDEVAAGAEMVDV